MPVSYTQRLPHLALAPVAHEEVCRCGSKLRVFGHSDDLAARCAFVEFASANGWDAIPTREDSSVVRWTCPACLPKKEPCAC